MKYKKNVVKKFMTEKQAQALVEKIKPIFAEKSELYAATDAAKYSVKQDIYDLDGPEWDDLYEKVEKFILQTNDVHFKFELGDFAQSLRIARYQPGYSHDWHLDYAPNDSSKIAFSVPLSGGFKGGEFQMLDIGTVPLGIGQAVVFPAFEAHRVTEVTKGERWVLLGWYGGPAFR